MALQKGQAKASMSAPVLSTSSILSSESLFAFSTSRHIPPPPPPQQREFVREKGIYQCVSCGNALFSSEQKYDSGAGWPSFRAPISEQSIKADTDTSHGIMRTEVKCSVCDAHLGHVFDDGPSPTELRYCINSGVIKFDGS